MTKSSPKQEVQIAVLQEQVKDLQVSVDKVLDNHLPHIQARLDSIEKKMAYYVGGGAALVATAQIIAQYIK